MGCGCGGSCGGSCGRSGSSEGTGCGCGSLCCQTALEERVYRDFKIYSYPTAQASAATAPDPFHPGCPCLGLAVLCGACLANVEKPGEKLSVAEYNARLAVCRFGICFAYASCYQFASMEMSGAFIGECPPLTIPGFRTVPKDKKICGPDVGGWLADTLLANRERLSRRFPVWGNIRTITYQLYNPINMWNEGWWFAHQVTDPEQWDYLKGPDPTATSVLAGKTCPQNCPKTVTLAGTCFFKDILGNINFGFVGSLRYMRSTLLLAADMFSKASGGKPDEPVDTAAINLGYDLGKNNRDSGKLQEELEKAIEKNKDKLNKFATEGCEPCELEYVP